MDRDELDCFWAEVEDHGLGHVDEIALLHWWDEEGNLEDFEDHYRGEYEADGEDEAIGEYLYDLEIDCGELSGVSDRFRNYIDWDRMGRDARLGGDFYAVYLHGHSYAIFCNY